LQAFYDILLSVCSLRPDAYRPGCRFGFGEAGRVTLGGRELKVEGDDWKENRIRARLPADIEDARRIGLKVPSDAQLVVLDRRGRRYLNSANGNACALVVALATQPLEQKKIASAPNFGDFGKGELPSTPYRRTSENTPCSKHFGE
jgi:hypothetical protein